MVIITGMDNSGKTTLCKSLGELMGLPGVHSPGPGLTLDEKRIWALDQIARERVLPNSVIYDRFMPLEEMVYGPILRGHSDFRYGDQVMEALAEINPTIIYTRPPRATILTPNGRDQMSGVIEKGEKLLAAWDDLYFEMEGNCWNMWVYDWTKGFLADEDIETIFGMGE